MKKMTVIALSLVMVLAMSSFVLAAGHPEAELQVGIEIGEQVEMGIVTDFFENASTGDSLRGLFNYEGMITGQPGLYVSDGDVTKDFAEEIFGNAGWDISAGQINDNNQNDVDMVVVAANHNTVLTMESVNQFAGWDNVPIMFRFSSHEGLPNDEFVNPVIQLSDALLVDNYNNAPWNYNNVLVERGNLSVTTLANLGDATGLSGSSWNYDPETGDNFDYITNVNGGKYTAEVYIPYRYCEPTLIHINGAILLEKLTAMEAGLQTTTLDFVVAAANEDA